jgi:uroporphyrinogen decarboxylase
MGRLKQDRMTEKKRWETLLARKSIDRVPFCLQSLGFSMVNVGYPQVAAYDNLEKSFWGQVWSNEMYGATILTFYLGGAPGAREFGGEVRMRDGEYEDGVSLKRPPVESEQDLERIERDPPEVKTAGAIPLFMAFSKLQEKHGLPITVKVGGVITQVSFMLGVERMCRWMLKRPELVHRACRLMTNFILQKIHHWVDTFGPERLLGYNGTPIESNQILSVRLFEQFALPYQKEIIEKARALGIRHFFSHICGEQNLNLPLWATFSHGEPGIISIGDEIAIEQAAKYFPQDIIFGNVNTTILQTGSPDEVYKEARVCIERGKKCMGGFILAPACDLPVHTPPHNVWMMRKAVNDFGWYS